MATDGRPPGGFLAAAMAESDVIEANATAAPVPDIEKEMKKKGKGKKKEEEKLKDKTVRLSVVLDCVNYERNHFNYIDLRDEKVLPSSVVLVEMQTRIRHFTIL